MYMSLRARAKWQDNYSSSIKIVEPITNLIKFITKY